MRKTIITSSSKISDLQRHLLNEKDIQTGIQIMPFEAYFYRPKINNKVDQLNQYDILQNVEFDQLKGLIKFPKFINDFSTFTKTLNAYSIDLEDLPNHTEYDKDIKKILISLNETMNKPDSSLMYLEEGLTHEQVTFLKLHNIPEFKMDTLVTPKQVIYKNALNFRQELEGAVQYILEENIQDVALIIPNKASNMPFVSTVFKRYGLNINHDFSFDLAKRQYLALVDYINKPTVESIFDLLETNVFKLNKIESLMFYIEHFQMTLDDIFSPFNHVVSENINSSGRLILKIQDEIQDDVILLQEHLNTINSAEFDDKFILGLQYIEAFNPATSRPFFSLIQETILHITYQNIPMVKHLIKNLSTTSKQNNNIKIYDLNDLPLLPVDTCIALGLDSKSLPGIKAKGGMLDEAYLRRVEGFPSQSDRNNFALDQKLKVFEKANNLILSYHVINFEGKPQEPSFPVESFTKKHGIDNPAPWIIKEADPFMDEKHTITPETAENLFLTNGVLRASVSSLEKYINDPYQYFIENALQLRKPFDFGFDSRVIGTLNHDVIEQFFKHGNAASYEGVWRNYSHLFSKNDPLIPILIGLNKEIVNFHKENIQDIYQETRFQNIGLEERITDSDIFQGFSMTGFVDRVDVATVNNSSNPEIKEPIMIVDYKSSTHSLSPARVLKGLQLQLLTYALILRKKYQRPIFGAYYYALNRVSTEQMSYRYLMSKGMIAPTAPDESTYKNSYKYEGWTFMEPSQFLDTADRFGGIRITKGVVSVTGTPYDIELVEEFMRDLYKSIYAHMMQGIIDFNDIDISMGKYPFKRKDVEPVNDTEVKDNE
ncbi:MAG: PD-(D/E)XK nuclease family protein [Erysipelothrix sp.]|nr:PD-(D/E)XK nuclease family protein [Erysipelothrix sp.]